VQTIPRKDVSAKVPDGSSPLTGGVMETGSGKSARELMAATEARLVVPENVAGMHR